MKANSVLSTLAAIGLICSASAPVHAAVILNGGFESGLSNWTVVTQIGSEGTFTTQTGTASPVNGFAVPAPPEGTTAAMTDAFGPGSRILYQDFIVPLFPMGAVVQFSVFVNNTAIDFFSPEHLDFGTPALNQQARVDLMLPAQDPFSTLTSDILQNLFRTMPGDPLVSGYTSYSVNASAVLQAYAGQTLRLRFANVDNVAPFNFGVDAVDISDAPEPATAGLVALALAAVVLARRSTGRGANTGS